METSHSLMYDSRTTVEALTEQLDVHSCGTAQLKTSAKTSAHHKPKCSRPKHRTISIFPRQTRRKPKCSSATSGLTSIKPRQAHRKPKQSKTTSRTTSIRRCRKPKQTSAAVKVKTSTKTRRTRHKPKQSSASAETEASSTETRCYQKEVKKRESAEKALASVALEVSTQPYPEQVERLSTAEADSTPESVRYPRRSVARQSYQEFMESSDDEIDAENFGSCEYNFLPFTVHSL